MRAPSPVALAVALCACRPGSGALPEVKVYAAVSPLAAEALARLAVNRRVARVLLVADISGAEVAWFGDPTEALAVAPLLVADSAPPQPDVADRWKDGQGRFFPLCVRARVLLVNPRAGLGATPRHLRALADPRLAGMQALAPLGGGEGPLTVAALAQVFGEPAALEFIAGVARAGPQLASGDVQVQALVASGRAAFGLAGSEQGAAGAVSAAALEVVYPDQDGSGTLTFPTAAAVLAPGKSSEGARRLAHWMATSDAEQLLVARVPGYLPIRGGVPLPHGVRSALEYRSPKLDWDRLAEAKRRLGPRLAAWPAP